MDFNGQLREKGYTLLVTPDGLQAILYITEEMQYPLTVEGLEQLLKDEDITTGIETPMLARIVNDKAYNQEFVVAKGHKAVNGEDGEFTFHFERELNTMPVVLEDGSVDYRDIELFVFVEKGQLLAEYKRATQGVMGFTVRGKLLMPVKGKEMPAIRGTGFIISQDATQYFAKYSGKIEYSKEDILDDEDDNSSLRQYMDISPAYIHEGDLLYREGDITFDGDVLVRGDVQSGVTIDATGNVEIEGTVESATIKSGGNVLIKKGVIGGSKGIIEANGTIKGTFFESVQLNTKEDIECNYLFNCISRADNMIKVKGNKGSIIAGKTHAVMGIEVFSVGNESGVRTILKAGMDAKRRAEYVQLEKKEEEIRTDIDIFEKNNFPENPFYSKIVLALEMKEEELKTVLEQHEEMKSQMQKAVRASVVAKGIVYAGVMIEIENRRLELTRQFRCVNFKIQEDHVAMFYN